MDQKEAWESDLRLNMEIPRYTVWLFQPHPTPSSVMVIRSILGSSGNELWQAEVGILGSPRSGKLVKGTQTFYVGRSTSAPTSPSDFRKPPDVKFKLFVSHKVSCGIIIIVSFTKKYINSSETQLGFYKALETAIYVFAYFRIKVIVCFYFSKNKWK